MVDNVVRAVFGVGSFAVMVMFHALGLHLHSSECFDGSHVGGSHVDGPNADGPQ